MTEDVPPISCLDGGRFVGRANAVLDRVAAQSGLRVRRSIQPFARGLKTVEDLPNSFLHVVVRTPARESLYRWVGPLDDCDVVVLTLSSSGMEFSPHAADARALRIGEVKGSPADRMVREAGMPERSIYQTPGSETSTRTLYAGHLDMVAGQLTVTHVLQKGYGCCFAFNRQVNEALLSRFATAFETLRSSGERKVLQDQPPRNARPAAECRSRGAEHLLQLAPVRPSRAPSLPARVP